MSYREHGYKPTNPFVTAYRFLEGLIQGEWMCKDRWWEKNDG